MNHIVDWEPSRPILQTLQPRKLSGARPRDSPGRAGGVRGGGEGQPTKPWANSGKAPTTTICTEELGLLSPSNVLSLEFYDLWNVQSRNRVMGSKERRGVLQEPERDVKRVIPSLVELQSWKESWLKMLYQDPKFYKCRN